MYSQYLALLLVAATASAKPCGRPSDSHSMPSGEMTSPAEATSTALPSSPSAVSTEDAAPTSSSAGTSSATGPSSIATTSSIASAASPVASSSSPLSSRTSATAAASPSSVASNSDASSSATQYCGAPDSYEVISGTPWIVYSMNYNYEDISGSCCTGYYDYTGSGDNQTIHWSSIWDISESVSTDVVKGYSFIGLTQNLETTLDDISSIPSTYQWSVSNTTAYKGNVVYDFMTSDTKGDSTSTEAQELMLWLAYEGGQVPIGWADGAVATIDGLFGKDGWQLYQGKNTDTGITVSSLLVADDNQFDGDFSGDIKDWLTAMSKQGIYSTGTYVNVGNAGMEPYWGTVTFDNYVSLRIELS